VVMETGLPLLIHIPMNQSPKLDKPQNKTMKMLFLLCKEERNNGWVCLLQQEEKSLDKSEKPWEPKRKLLDPWFLLKWVKFKLKEKEKFKNLLISVTMLVDFPEWSMEKLSHLKDQIISWWNNGIH
jgi:hypothetical protein